ncbi:hypothetical protein Hanom_Chr03g00197001 [Helianthus anomalus]
MYMPVPKPGECSSNGPSDADVIRAAESLQAAEGEVEAATKTTQEETHEATDSSDSDDLFEENEINILMCRITVLEEDKIFKDAQIASLMEELVVKNQKINELETNLGALSAKVMDVKRKLEGKFPKEFADPPKETTAEDREKERRDMRRLWIVTLQTLLVQRIRNQGKDDKHGNRFGIHNWAYNDEKGMFIVKRRNGDCEYYDNSASFESWTVVDLRELSNAGFHNQTKNPNCKIGWNFFNKLQQQARVNSKDMKLAESTIEEDEEVLDPAPGKPYKSVKWPATKQTKIVPLHKELPDNSVKDLQFCMYDPITGQDVIVCDNVEYRFLDTRDLMCFGENDINLSANTQIQRDRQYEMYEKRSKKKERNLGF